jgi:hypothetical protein
LARRNNPGFMVQRIEVQRIVVQRIEVPQIEVQRIAVPAGGDRL